MDHVQADPLLQAVAAWLETQPVQQHPTDGCLLLGVDVVELACSQQHPEVVEALLTDPEVLRQAVIAVLERTAALPQGQRLWLRPRQLIAAAELSVREAQDCMRSAPGALFSCHGVCVAASAPFQLPAARTFRCACCSNEFTQHSHGAAASPKPCCTEAALLEVEQARVMVQGQVVFLTGDVQLGASLVAVHLADDLCGRVRVGDQVLATGCGRYYDGDGAMSGPQAGQVPIMLSVKMEACNVEVLRPAVLGLAGQLGAGARSHLAAMAAGSLEPILSVLDTALPVAATPLLKLAVLLSAAAAGTGSTQLGEGEQEEEDPEPQAVLQRRAPTSRNQVHVMLTAAGPEPHIDRFLDAAAATLCDHSMHADPRALLPRLDAKWVEPSLGLPVPLALGGQLGEAAPGLLLLSSSALDARAAIGLGQLLAAGEAVLCPGCLELCVSVGATLWTMVQEQDLSKSGLRGGAAALSITQRIINRFSHPFFCHHDLLVGASPETEEEVEAVVDSILLAHAAGPPTGPNAAERADACCALRHHLQASRAAAQPVVSLAAGALLSAYFQHLRTHQDAQQGVLASLVRVACACARLRHSPRAELLPDAAVAVAFVEEKLVAAGSEPHFWPRWREELQRSTELRECLRGLVEDCGKGLGLGAAAEEQEWLAAEE